MKKIIRLTESDLARIVRRVINEQVITLKPGMTGEGTYSDTAEGKNYSVVKVNTLSCDLVEVTFKNIKSSRVEIAYYKPSNVTSKLIRFRRFGEGVKSENPCGEFESFGDFGRLQF
jgi:hypothetical protein